MAEDNNSTLDPQNSLCKESPCPTCPYRKDTPKGVWALDHYEVLQSYDGSILEQAISGATAVFQCHYNDGNLCRGWLDCHGKDNLLALRLRGREALPEDIGPVKHDVYESGRACLEANIPHMDNPSKAARDVQDVLLAKHGKRFDE